MPEACCLFSRSRPSRLVASLPGSALQDHQSESRYWYISSLKRPRTKPSPSLSNFTPLSSSLFLLLCFSNSVNYCSLLFYLFIYFYFILFRFTRQCVAPRYFNILYCLPPLFTTVTFSPSHTEIDGTLIINQTSVTSSPWRCFCYPAVLSSASCSPQPSTRVATALFPKPRRLQIIPAASHQVRNSLSSASSASLPKHTFHFFFLLVPIVETGDLVLSSYTPPPPRPEPQLPLDSNFFLDPPPIRRRSASLCISPAASELSHTHFFSLVVACRDSFISPNSLKRPLLLFVSSLPTPPPIQSFRTSLPGACGIRRLDVCSLTSSSSYASSNADRPSPSLSASLRVGLLTSSPPASFHITSPSPALRLAKSCPDQDSLLLPTL